MPQYLGRQLRTPWPTLGAAIGRTADTEADSRIRDGCYLAHAALVACPELRTVAAVLEWSTTQLISRFEFDRAMALTIDGSHLRIASTTFRDQSELERLAHENALHNPVEIRPRGLEREMLRRCAPALVDTRDDDLVWRPIIDQLETPVYVAAPVLAFGSPVATLHADSFLSGRLMDPQDRDVLGLFAQVCGLVLERAILFEDLARLRGAVAAGAVQLLELAGTEDLPLTARGPDAPRPSQEQNAKSSMDTLPLTRREVEILRLMAKGATGAEIARVLVLAPGTVKTHARNILRKLDAGTRAEAVAKFLVREDQ